MLSYILQCISTINFHICSSVRSCYFIEAPVFLIISSFFILLQSHSQFIYILKEHLVFYFLSGESVECASSNFGSRSQFTADLDQFDQLLPTLRRHHNCQAYVRQRVMDGAVTNVAIKSREILPSALQSTTARPTSRLNSVLGTELHFKCLMMTGLELCLS